MAWRIEDLVGPYGVVGEPRLLTAPGWLPPGLSVFVAGLGDLGALRGAPIPGDTNGVGRALHDPTLARRIAICEAAERYSCLFGKPVKPIVATSRELGTDALSLDDVPRCSVTELRRPDIPMILPDPDAQIRWTQAAELTSGRSRLVPLTMARMLPPELPGEHYWMTISTGCAIHRTRTRALLSGLYEVVERDALAVAWLRRLALPRLDPATFVPDVEEMLAWYAERGVTVHVFDATTDVPIPVVLCVVDAPHEKRVSQCLGAAGGADVREAARKAVLEAAPAHAALGARPTAPRRYRDFNDSLAGPAYMGRPGRRRAWSFLLDGAAGRRSARPAVAEFANDEQELAWVLGLFREREIAVYATEVTPREIESVGYTVMQVLIPALQPVSLHPIVQYRGHARLTHDHPVAAGGATPRLNRWPLPMS
jgi:ribosomal protein S12 methylthiotransferase accessory factor